MVGYGHELGQRWVPEDGVVWQANLGDVEVDDLGAVFVACPEGDNTTRKRPTNGAPNLAINGALVVSH